MLLKTYKLILIAKICSLFLSILGIAFYSYSLTPARSYSQNIFLLDVSTSMDTPDIRSGESYITRLELAKKYIASHIDNEQGTWGLIIFSNELQYTIPPTDDIVGFEKLLAQIHTRTLPEGDNIVGLLELIANTNKSGTSYILLSDMDRERNERISTFTIPIRLIGIGNDMFIGEPSPGNIPTLRNDQLAEKRAKQPGISYQVISDVDDIATASHHKNTLSTKNTSRLLLFSLAFLLLGL